MPLVPEAKKAHKLWSIQAMTVTEILIIVELINQTLPIWEGVIPEGAFAIAAAATGSIAMFLRLLKQRNLGG